MKSKLLVIDDEPAIRDTMRMLLEYDGFEVSLAASGQEGLAMVEKDSPDLVFLDVKMPGMDGLEVLSRLKGMNEALPVVIVSAHGTTATALEAGRLGAFRFIEKPLSKDYVLDAVREGLELGNLRRENRQLRSALETRHQVVGDAPGLRTIMDQVRRAAPTSATVLILGESGVGKELIAPFRRPKRSNANPKCPKSQLITKPATPLWRSTLAPKCGRLRSRPIGTTVRSVTPTFVWSSPSTKPPNGS
jgi:two-component system nitrogen regulation response regulator NtrX